MSRAQGTKAAKLGRVFFSLVFGEFPEHSWKNGVLLDNRLYYLENDKLTTGAKLIRRDLISGESEVLYQGAIQWNETSVDIDPSGRALFLSRPGPASDDIYGRELSR